MSSLRKVIGLAVAISVAAWSASPAFAGDKYGDWKWREHHHHHHMMFHHHHHDHFFRHHHHFFHHHFFHHHFFYHHPHFFYHHPHHFYHHAHFGGGKFSNPWPAFYVIGGAASVMFDAAVVWNTQCRELTSQEAMASFFLPVIGDMLVAKDDDHCKR